MKATSSDRPTRVRVRPLALGLAAAIAAAPACAMPAPIVESHAFPAERTHAPWAAHPWPAAAVVPPRTAAVLPVTSCSDDPDDPGTLRNVMAGAESGDTVDLSQLACSTISLENGAIVTPVSGLTVVGPGRDMLTIDAGGTDRVFADYHNSSSSTFTVSAVTLTGGHRAYGFGGCIYTQSNLVLTDAALIACSVGSASSGNRQFGGAASVLHDATISGSVISGNSTVSSYYAAGGALNIQNSGTITNSVITGNSATGDAKSTGGAIYCGRGLTISGSTISGNSAVSSSTHGRGGALFVRATTTIVGSTLADNHVDGNGGALLLPYVGGNVRIDVANSTISGNSASNAGGGLSVSYKPLVLRNSTVASNTATNVGGGGIYFLAVGGLQMQSTIVANNAVGAGASFAADLGGPVPIVVDGANNLVISSDFTLPADTLHDDPLLLPLADNGGRMPTRALSAGSPAIDTGNNASGFDFDQRGDGFARVVGPAADIGAFEVQVSAPPVAPSLAKAFEPATILLGHSSTLTLTLINTNPTIATLDSNLVDAFPDGLVVADPANATTDCPGGVANAVVGGGTLTLLAGAGIPAGAGCSVSVSVTSAAAGVYTNLVPAGALHTDLGDNAEAVSANLTAELETFVVSPNAGPGGGIEPDAPQVVDSGDTVTFTLIPEPGRHVAGIGGTCGGVLAGNVFTTSPVTANCTVEAIFTEIDTFTVTTSTGPGGTIEPNAPQTVPFGTVLAFDVTPDASHSIAGVSGCGGTLFNHAFTTAPITSDCTVSAQFVDLGSYLKFAPASVPTPGSRHQDGPGVHLLVAAQDSGEPGKRIFLSSIEDDAGLYGFDGRTGASLPGFAPAALPTSDRGGVVYPLAIATTLASGASGYDILAAHYKGALRLFDAGGDVVWDHGAANYVAMPGSSYGPVGAEAMQDARFVVDEESFTVFGRSGRSGEVIWHGNGTAQQFATPAVVDPGTPDAAFVLGSGTGNDECDVQRLRIDSGAMVWSDHLLCYATTFVAVGDIDGVAGDEVVAVLKSDSAPSVAIVSVLDAGSGVLKWAYPLSEASLSGTAPALADIDGDGAAEIVVQTETTLHVLKYGVGELAGWPALLCNGCRMGNSAPVVGDLDGDPELEIAVVTQQDGSDQTGYLHVFGPNGERKLFDGPVQMPIGAGRAPAIADVDGDGHNELLVGGVAASNPSLYVLDFSLGNAAVRHGPVPWGQFGADAQHRNRPASTAPTLAKGFAPANVATGQPSVLTLTLGNVRVTPATLAADLVDLLPTGLAVADPPNASTDCPDGSVGAAPGAGGLTLAAGTRIPALGTCTVTAAVVAAAEGVYTNVIPAAALRTDLGSSADPASAVLVVRREQVPDRLFADGFDGSGGGLCVPQQLLADPGFESTDPIAFTNPFWSVFSATFGTPLCNAIDCGDGGGSAYPRSGAFWSWFGGIDHAAESAGVAQTVTIPAGAPRFVNFWLFVGTVGGAGAALDVTVDGATVGSFPEPAIPDGDYVARSVDVSAFADGGAHAIGFAYAQSANGGTTNYSLDDVTLDCRPASSSPRTSPHAATASPNRRRR